MCLGRNPLIFIFTLSAGLARQRRLAGLPPGAGAFAVVPPGCHRDWYTASIRARVRGFCQRGPIWFIT